MPDEIREALPRLYELLQKMGLPLFRLDGVEADDVIATLAVRALARGMRVDIASPDKVRAAPRGEAASVMRSERGADQAIGKIDRGPDQSTDKSGTWHYTGSSRPPRTTAPNPHPGAWVSYFWHVTWVVLGF